MVSNDEIIVLPEEIAIKIAAGEIIERPVNVVKELVENALDAGSDEIKIEITRGGKGLIRVSDNGKGVLPHELKKTILRFGTSKIRSLDDLTKIDTFGFRGEALAAISSISNFSIKSGRDSFDTYELSVDFGKINSFSMVAAYKGTIVTVKNIFMEVPARYRFLRSNGSETREITNLIKQFIIINSNVTFRYYVDGKKIYNYIKGDNALGRTYELLGEKNLKSIEYKDHKYTINSIISDPSIQKYKADNIIISVNRRIVKDNIILKAIKQAYSFALPHNRYPVVIFNITVEGSEIDINVHPAKHMIKWLNPNEIFHLIYNVIRNNVSLENIDLIKENDLLEAKFLPNDNKYIYKYKEVYNLPPLFNDEVYENNLLVKKDRIKVIGQLFDTVILVEKDNKIYFIDQHIAHERILFEKFLQNNILDNNVGTYLSEPILYEFDLDKIEFLEHSINEFGKIGFEFERFGRNAIKLTKVPSYLLKNEVGDIFEALINEIDEISDETLKFKIIASLSCKAAVKANEKLSNVEMEKIVNDLFKTKNPYTCPHGRKIIYELSKEALYKKFNRLQ
jgi:DNA mismatch repair protein MutL